MSSYFLTLRWRWTKVMVGLLIFEFFWTIAMLTLAGVADPNTYRTKLWQNGADHGFNSSPSFVTSSQGSGHPITTPLVWSTFVTKFNVVISVLSMFILLVKAAMFLLHAFVPMLSVLVHIALVVLYAYSTRIQSAPDLADPNHPSPGMPWMMSKGCSYATEDNFSYCQQASAQFAVTIIGMVLFVVYLVPSVYSCVPTQGERDERDESIELKRTVFANAGKETDEERAEKWERSRQMIQNMPKTPTVHYQFTPGGGLNPMTPRTTAFTTLTGQPPTAKQPTFSPRELPLREYRSDEPLNRHG